jgi:hypothetical protein
MYVAPKERRLHVEMSRPMQPKCSTSCWSGCVRMVQLNAGNSKAHKALFEGYMVKNRNRLPDIGGEAQRIVGDCEVNDNYGSSMRTDG